MSNRKSNLWRKCVYCGRYMKYDDMISECSHYQPDTPFTVEGVWYWHKECSPTYDENKGASDDKGPTG